MKEIILATNNKGKIAELKALLPSFHCLTQKDFNLTPIEETGLSFVENALLKARHASHFTKKPALADDSGLVVDALNGEPGIYSARYAGEHATDEENITTLLKNLEQLHGRERRAYYFCAIVFILHENDPTPIIAQGRWEGIIARAPCGDGGFGYDPIFYLPSHQCTASELPLAIKNTLSHRAKALTQLKQHLNE